MKTYKIMIMGLSASCLIAWGATPSFAQMDRQNGQFGQATPASEFGATPGQGLIGERYFGVDGGWERFENGTSDDGWGVGAELNIPFPRDPNLQFGTDLKFQGSYTDVLDSDIYDVDGVIRGYAPDMEGFTPFAGVGFGWVDFDEVTSTYLPLEAGIEFGLGQMALVPYFRYSFAFDSAVDDFWEVGTSGVYWLDAGWGVTASVTYTDYDEIGGAETIDNSIGARLGLVFAY